MMLAVKERFRQELNLRDGSLLIESKIQNSPFNIRLWVDANRPVIHIEGESNQENESVRWLWHGGLELTAKMLDNPGSREVLIPALATATGQKITAVSRLGYTGKLEWHQDATGLRVTMSKPQPADHVVVLKVL